ncbi:MAG: RagB/SusD family nutrient uptake outer membrane protein, partial [Bacteroidota bacterium]
MKTKNNFLIIILLMLITACGESWLEMKPLSINTPENIYVNKQGMESVLLSLRKNLRADFYGGNPMPMTLEYISSDYGVAGEQRQDMVIDHV